MYNKLITSKRENKILRDGRYIRRQKRIGY